MVTILVFGETLRQAIGESEVQVAVGGPTTVRALLVESQPETLGALAPFLQKGEVLVTVNKKVAVLDSAVKDGDTVKLTHQCHPTFEGARWHNP